MHLSAHSIGFGASAKVDSRASVPADHGLTRERPKLYVQCTDSQQRQWLDENGCSTIASLSSSESAAVSEAPAEAKTVRAAVSESTSVLMELQEASKSA